jgi:hypothetical protein
MICDRTKRSWYACGKILRQSFAGFVHSRKVNAQSGTVHGTVHALHRGKLRVAAGGAAGVSLNPGNCQAFQVL